MGNFSGIFLTLGVKVTFPIQPMSRPMISRVHSLSHSGAKKTPHFCGSLFSFFFFFFCRAVCLFPPSSLAVSSLPLWNPVHFSRFFCLVRLSLAFFGPQNITVTTGGMSDEASRQLALEWLYEFCLVQCTNTMMANDPSYAGWGNIVERKQSLSHSGSRLTVAKKQKKKNTKTSTTSCQRWPRCAATSSSCARRLPS